MSSQAHQNRLTLAACAFAAAFMLALAFAAVPLYQLFCQVTGYGGTPRIGAVETAPPSASASAPSINVRFDASVHRDMAWDFQPPAAAMQLALGARALAFYTAHNPTDEPIVGVASFNVMPAKAAIYFTKLDCFCFEEQKLAAGERAQLPVTFQLDPAFADDPTMHDVREMVLSYTFFPAQL